MIDGLWQRLDESEAAVVRRHMNEVPVRVGALAEELGLRVFRSVLPPNVSGMIKPSDDEQGVYDIRINKFESPERQRFTLAHEIAHFLLHKTDIRAGVIDNIMYRSQLTSRKEAEANRMAADIVMPSAAVSAALKRAGGVVNDDTVDRLAAQFRVSVPAMKIRLGS
ncbi:ImmA/IrrE family metallo-endopeptidase [Brevundimonas aurantiaca]|uniref:ImmA/IrrE family metallo-endopeptidase n=1 Tax=Brevundimonas aurantiaca TaxID=74316 RepID=UPI0030161EE4